MPDSLKNYYSILGLDFFESKQSAIKSAYQDVTQKYRPGQYSGEDIRERLIEVNEAFLVLSDSKTKKLYDSALSAEPDVDYDILTGLIKAKRYRAEAFISSYFNGTQKKKKSVWKIIGIILLCFLILGTIGRILSAILISTQTDSHNSSTPAYNYYSPSKTLGKYNAPSDWNNYKINNAFSISVPPTLELRQDYDIYSQFIRDHFFTISNADAVFQQRDLKSMTKDALSNYCRIMASQYYLGADEVEHHYESPQLGSEDYNALRNIADSELGPWSYIKTPTYQWIDINETKAVDISYTREGAEGEVICHIYLFFNYDEMAKIITAYRKSDQSQWETDVNNVIRTFKWVNTK